MAIICLYLFLDCGSIVHNRSGGDLLPGSCGRPSLLSDCCCCRWIDSIHLSDKERLLILGRWVNESVSFFVQLIFFQFYRLFGGLWILILGGFLQLFVGGEVTDTAMAVFGAILFSGKL